MRREIGYFSSIPIYIKVTAVIFPWGVFSAAVVTEKESQRARLCLRVDNAGWQKGAGWRGLSGEDWREIAVMMLTGKWQWAMGVGLAQLHEVA